MDPSHHTNPTTFRGFTPSPDFVDRFHGNDSPEPSDTTVINSPRIQETILDSANPPDFITTIGNRRGGSDPDHGSIDIDAVSAATAAANPNPFAPTSISYANPPPPPSTNPYRRPSVISPQPPPPPPPLNDSTTAPPFTNIHHAQTLQVGDAGEPDFARFSRANISSPAGNINGNAESTFNGSLGGGNATSAAAAAADESRTSSPVNSVEAFAESRRSRVRDRAGTMDSTHSDQIGDALNRTMSRATRRFSTYGPSAAATAVASANANANANAVGSQDSDDDLEKRITEETYPPRTSTTGADGFMDSRRERGDHRGDGSGGATAAAITPADRDEEKDTCPRQFGWVDTNYLDDLVAGRSRQTRRNRRSTYEYSPAPAETLKGSSDISEAAIKDLYFGEEIDDVDGMSRAGGTGGTGGGGGNGVAGDKSPTRFTFFSSEAQTTIHSTGIGGLIGPGETFRDLFSLSREGGVWWLDVVNPDKAELDAIAKAFSIHPLTAEDILTQENREKVELFKNYYFVCFRTFSSHTVAANYDSSNDIDSIISVSRPSRKGSSSNNNTNTNNRDNNDGNNNNNHNNNNNSSSAEETKELLEPLNIYMVVFRGAILTFSFEPHMHAKNVRRRIGRLRDFVSLSSDWVCYAMIDDIVDSFGPVMRDIETESETIEDQVFTARIEDFALFLSQIGNLRKKVMGMMRLLGGKADVIRGFAKRCNEEYNVTPHGDIGLYLGDIQDHVVTMTTNLAHLEKMLSRSHGNYLASLSVKNIMVGNYVNRALTKITFIATILVPLNMISSLFGMNVKVPGQDVETTQWFWGIVGLIIGIVLLSTSLARRFKLI